MHLVSKGGLSLFTAGGKYSLHLRNYLINVTYKVGRLVCNKTQTIQVLSKALFRSALQNSVIPFFLVKIFLKISIFFKVSEFL